VGGRRVGAATRIGRVLAISRRLIHLGGLGLLMGERRIIEALSPIPDPDPQTLAFGSQGDAPAEATVAEGIRCLQGYISIARRMGTFLKTVDKDSSHPWNRGGLVLFSARGAPGMQL